MPFCPKCKYEYVVGIEKCADCGASLIESLPEEPDLPDIKLELVYTASYEYETGLIKDVLESAGIKSYVLVQRDRNYPAPGNLSLIKLFVEEKNAEQAKEIIGDIIKSESKKEDNNGDE